MTRGLLDISVNTDILDVGQGAKVGTVQWLLNLEDATVVPVINLQDL